MWDLKSSFWVIYISTPKKMGTAGIQKMNIFLYKDCVFTNFATNFKISSGLTKVAAHQAGLGGIFFGCYILGI